MNFLRQKGIVAPELLELPILIVGAGSISSYTALALAKMGCTKLKIVDFDRVENHNIPNQFFTVKDEGKFKSEALSEGIYNYTGIRPAFSKTRFCEADMMFIQPRGIVIMGPDNMEVRKSVYNSAKNINACIRLIDGRMGGLSLEVFNIDPHQKKDQILYQKKLFSDDEAVSLPCTEKGIIYPVMTVASIIASCVRNTVTSSIQKRRFIIDYKNMMFMIED